MQHAVRQTVLRASLPVLLAASLTGCSGDDVMTTIGLRTTQSAPAHGTANAAPPGLAHPTGQSNAVAVTKQQRAYLEALADGGVQPSSDLRALSIGSYVCQARAAKQTDQAVWDFVLPLVRDDLRDDRRSSVVPSAADVQTATADYIRIATERLC